MQTFTLDSHNGEMNPGTRWIENKTRERLKEVIEEFVKDCVKNNIEMCSSDGFFLEMVFQELTMSRIKQVCELNKKEKSEQKQENTQ